MRVVAIPTDQILDWPSFHDVFAKAMGFPRFYGRNLDAFVDCMRSLDTPNDGLSSVKVESGGLVTLDLGAGQAFRERCPDQYAAVVEISAWINAERLDRFGEPPLIALAFH
jgi:hypothetical protein